MENKGSLWCNSFMSEGLRTRAAHDVTPTLRTQGHWCGSWSLKPRVPEVLMSKGRSGWISQLRERLWSSSAYFVLFRSITDSMRPTHVGEGTSCLFSLLIEMFLSSGNIFPQTHAGIMFYQLSGHPLAQSSWHIKFTTTVYNIQIDMYLLLPQGH